MATFKIDKKQPMGLPLLQDEVLVGHFRFIIDALKKAQELGATEVSIWDPAQDNREGNRRAIATLGADGIWSRSATVGE